MWAGVAEDGSGNKSLRPTLRAGSVVYGENSVSLVGSLSVRLISCLWVKDSVVLI